MTPDEEIARLERRVERERRARQEAEDIAERGMRDLWLANQELEERVAERTAELELSLRAATMAGQAKEAFLAELGHELATPLHAVLGLLELIEQDVMSNDDRKRLGDAISHARELADLLRGLVELAGAEGAVHPDEMTAGSPAAWLDEITSAWTRRLAHSGHLLVPVNNCAAEHLVLPWSRLRRVVDLLLDNAHVHAVSGPVRLEISHDTGSARFSCVVADSGPGLDADRLAMAFEPFVRFGDQSHLGIGLSLASRLARAADGDVTIDSDGVATTVTVALPTAPA